MWATEVAFGASAHVVMLFYITVNWSIEFLLYSFSAL